MAKLIVIAALLPILPSALAAEIYRWEDERGKTHYGEVVPEQFKSSTRRVGVAPQPTPDQRGEASKRASRDREAADRLAAERQRNAGVQRTVAAENKTSRAPNRSETPCEREWRIFAESNECFAPYMMGSRGVKAEAFDKCVEVKAPACGPLPGGFGPR